MKYFYNDDWVKSCKMHDDNYKPKGKKMRNNILAIVAFYAVVSTILGGLVIYAQAENNKQLIYDLNCSQTAFKIQQNEIAQGLCLKNLGVLHD